jgi:phospholipid/cholesterol/gamma-HCH transport system substrate-binding protein
LAKFYQHLRSTRIKTGIWTVVILVILIFGYLWLSNRLTVKKQQELRVLFTEVMGLETGDKIMYRGMEAGRVKSVKLHNGGILVSGKISSDITIPQGSRFIIEDSLMGSKSLNILPSSAAENLNLSEIQQGDTPVGMMGMISQAAEMLQKMDAILDDLNAEGGMLDMGEKLLHNTDRAVSNASGNLSALKHEISLVIEKVDMLTAQARDMVQENRESIHSTLQMAPATLEKVNSTLDSLRSLSVNLNRSALALTDSSGTAGRLLNEDTLHRKLLESIHNLDALVEDIKKNPGKYIKFSVF